MGKTKACVVAVGGTKAKIAGAHLQFTVSNAHLQLTVPNAHFQFTMSNAHLQFTVSNAHLQFTVSNAMSTQMWNSQREERKLDRVSMVIQPIDYV